MSAASPLEPASSSAEGEAAAVAKMDELSWAITKMKAGARILIDAQLIEAFRASSSPHSLRALRSDLEAFDLWCRRANRIALPALPETVADYVDAGKAGGKPASLGRYKASTPRSSDCSTSLTRRRPRW